MYNLTILDSKPLDGKTWMLCRGNLNEYLSELRADFYNFSIQRKIVKNQYLDTLVTTVKQGDPIPVITLTYQQEEIETTVGSQITVDMNKIEILDGLQRTYRLWAHKVMVDEYEQNKDRQIIAFTKDLKSKFPDLFDTGVLSLTKIKALEADDGFNSIEHAYSSFDLYFVIWVNLTPKQIVHKMLLLNAGQRSVSKTHQFELLFLYLWEELQNKTDVKLYREKDKDFTPVKNGIRSIGDYLFSSIIVGLRSFLERKPLRVTTDDLDFDEFYNEAKSGDVNEEIFTTEFLGEFLSNLKKLDKLVNDIEPEEGKKWFVKDTTLSGILAAIGEFGQVRSEMSVREISNVSSSNFVLLMQRLEHGGLNLKAFTEQYNVLSSRSVNIGSFIRKVVMHYILAVLREENPTWEDSFRTNLKKDLQ